MDHLIFLLLFPSMSGLKREAKKKQNIKTLHILCIQNVPTVNFRPIISYKNDNRNKIQYSLYLSMRENTLIDLS